MITSEKNPRIQIVRALNERSKDRKKQHAFVAEGVRLVEEVLKAQWPVEFILFSENLSERGRQLLESFEQTDVPMEEIPLNLMKKLADTEMPQGILAVVKQPDLKMPAYLNFVLICDSIRDPGNLGTLIRTAAAAGVQAVFLSPGTTDPYAPKVLRSGMGAHFRIPVMKLDWDQILNACKQQTAPLSIYMAAADADRNCWQADFRKPTAILVGSEAFGPGHGALGIADQAVAIPMPGQSESLNAAVAASILLFETVRQRYT